MRGRFVFAPGNEKGPPVRKGLTPIKGFPQASTENQYGLKTKRYFLKMRRRSPEMWASFHAHLEELKHSMGQGSHRRRREAAAKAAAKKARR